MSFVDLRVDLNEADRTRLSETRQGKHRCSQWNYNKLIHMVQQSLGVWISFTVLNGMITSVFTSDFMWKKVYSFQQTP